MITRKIQHSHAVRCCSMVQKVVKPRVMILVGTQGYAVAPSTWVRSFFIGRQLWSEQAYENVDDTAMHMNGPFISRAEMHERPIMLILGPRMDNNRGSKY